MKFPVYCVRDSLIGFGMPVLRDNDAVATRSFEFDITRDDSPFKQHPEHIQFYHIGEFDTDSGEITGCSPRLVASAVDFVGKEK